MTMWCRIPLDGHINKVNKISVLWKKINDTKKGAKHFKNCDKFCARFTGLVGLDNYKMVFKVEPKTGCMTKRRTLPLLPILLLAHTPSSSSAEEGFPLKTANKINYGTEIGDQVKGRHSLQKLRINQKSPRA